MKIRRLRRHFKNMLAKTLENCGLTRKQAKVYLALLELGPSPIQKISQRAVLSRSTVYEALRALQKKVLVSTFKKKKVNYFTAEEPQKIVKKARAKALALTKALPHLEALQYRAKSQPTVRFYQGKRGLQTVIEEMLEEPKEILAISSSEDIFNVLEDYFPRFVERRIKKKIPIRTIFKDSPKARERKALGPQQLRKAKLLPKDYQFSAMLALWKNKIALLSLKKEFNALVIESEELSEMHKALFHFIWDSLPE